METGTNEHPARLRVGVIGPGRAGTALARALARAGHVITAASAVSAASKRRAHENFPDAELGEPAQVIEDADLVLLTVPDDVLPGLVEGLANTGAPYQGRLLAHASGAHGIRVLDPATAAGALPLAIHPVMTFTGRDDDVDRIKGVSFGVTAPEQLRPAAEALVIEMGGEPVFIAEENRHLYHAALAFAANHLVTLVAEAADMLGKAGADNPGRMLGPLLGAALDNALRFGDAGLTGPVARGDDGTVAAHLAAIREAEPGALPAYLALARLTADRALATGLLKPNDAERLLGVLGDRMIVATTRAELKAARDKLPGPVVLVPTMGALHDGHRALLRRAREIAGAAGTVAVSIFVNPLQFGPNEDLDRYPRTLREDLETCAAEHVDLVFAPGVGEMYPRRQLVTVDPGAAGEILEGEFRPGFFQRRADRGAQAVQPGAPGRRRVRPEGRAAARAGAPDGRRLRARHRDRGRADGARRGRARVVEQEQVPVFIGTYGGDCPAQSPCRGRGGRRARSPRGARRCPAGAGRGGGQALDVDYLALVSAGTYEPVLSDDFSGTGNPRHRRTPRHDAADRQRDDPGRDGTRCC